MDTQMKKQSMGGANAVRGVGPSEDYGLGDSTSLPIDTKYLKVTLEQAFAENGDDIFLGLIDHESYLAFTVMVNNFKLQNLSLKEEVFVSCHIGEDYIEKELYGGSMNRKRNSKNEDVHTNINNTIEDTLN